MSVTLAAYQPSQLPALVLFLNRVLAGHRHWTPISEADFRERVLDQPAFDSHGLIVAWAGDVVVGGVHALKPPSGVSYASCAPGHQIVWLAVTPQYRQQQVGSRLLMAAEDYLRACPVYFAGQSAPLYGIIEKLWAPWYGSTERMGVSAIHAAGWIEWLLRRGYTAVNPGDVSLAALLHERERPGDPGLAQHGLRLVPINQHAPWTGAEPVYRLRRWGTNGGRPYQGLVVADDGAAVGSAVWYPLPDGVTAALAWIGLERRYRGLRFGSYLLDRALAEMAHGGYTAVEVHAHTRENPEAVAMFRHRGFEVIDYWVNLAKT